MRLTELQRYVLRELERDGYYLEHIYHPTIDRKGSWWLRNGLREERVNAATATGLIGKGVLKLTQHSTGSSVFKVTKTNTQGKA